MTINLGQKIVWDPVVGAVSYRVRTKLGGFPVVESVVSVPEIASSVALAGQPHQQYTISVASGDGIAYGAEASIVVDFLALSPPSNIAVV